MTHKPGTIAHLCHEKKLDPEWLVREFGLADEPDGVSMPYRDYDGTHARTKVRRPPGSNERFRWRGQGKNLLYGRWLLGRARKYGYLFLAEGETDFWTLQAHGLPSAGVPGANSANCLEAEDLSGIRTLYICVDRKNGFRFVESVAKRLGVLGYDGEVLSITMPEDRPEIGDVNDLHVAMDGDKERFLAAWAERMSAAKVPEGWPPTPRQRPTPPLTRLKLAQPRQEPETPEAKVIEPKPAATLADLKAAGAGMRWLWPSWIPTAVVSLLAAEPGCGKTRFVCDLIRRIRHGERWPDDTPIEVPSDAKVLFVLADNNHDELLQLAHDFNIVDSILLNAPPEDPRAGTTLELLDHWGDLEARIKNHKPALVVVDTVGNATGLNLCKPEDAKAFFTPLQVLAAKYETAIMAVTHLNATGGVLGRRALEKVRSALHLSQPDPQGQPDRRALSVIKSNTRKPPPLGVTMSSHGNAYDDDVPVAPGDEPGQRGRTATKSPACADWLHSQLENGPRPLAELIRSGELSGFPKPRVYDAGKRLAVAKFEQGNRLYWSLPGHANPHDGDRPVHDLEGDE